LEKNSPISKNIIVALSTPPGVGALGVIRLSGIEAITLVDNIFSTKDLTKQKANTLHFGKIKDGAQTLDEVVVSLFRAPASYTGEDTVEISCHGSPFILQKVLELCIRKGATMAQPGEFTMRAFMNGKMDLSQAEAVADLIASSTEASHEMALYQLRGGYSKRIEELRQRLIKFASLVELELDFGEEDVEFADRAKLKELVENIQKTVTELISGFRLGNVIKTGVSTVIAGRPNAGKSTLLNVLLNEERAIVSEIAGTTRDTIEEVINIKGIPFRLIDTAGIREATDKIESIGVEKTMEKIQSSSAVVYVYDVSRISFKTLGEDIEALDFGEAPVLILANKTDLLSSLEVHTLSTLGVDKYGSNFQLIQAKNNHNIGAVREQLYQLIQSGTALSHTAVSNARHYAALNRAQKDLDTVLNGLSSGLSGDLMALDIRGALDALGEITGQVTTDDLLDSIFRDFCIGK